MKRFYSQSVGVPAYEVAEYHPKSSDYALLIPIINEGARIGHELSRAQDAGVDRQVDIIICDGGSTDGATADEKLRAMGVRALLVKKSAGKQGAQLRMGISWALAQEYQGIVTIDGNDKDSIEDVSRFLQKLKEGYDFVQGSRFIKGGQAENTPLIRYLAVRLLHAPIISLSARHWFTDTTNAYRAYSRRYLTDERVQPLRDIFQGYELLAYLSVRATQIGMRACEIPVRRSYPVSGATPTKIRSVRGNIELFMVLLRNAMRRYHPA